jgi:hypothetical protein
MTRIQATYPIVFRVERDLCPRHPDRGKVLEGSIPPLRVS